MNDEVPICLACMSEDRQKRKKEHSREEKGSEQYWSKFDKKIDGFDTWDVKGIDWLVLSTGQGQGQGQSERVSVMWEEEIDSTRIGHKA